MSDGPCEPRRDGEAPQPGAELAAAVGQLGAGGPQIGQIMRHFSSASLSISSPGRATQGASASGYCEDPFHGQAPGESRQAPPSIRQGKPLHIERSGQPSGDRVVRSRARSWLRDGKALNGASQRHLCARFRQLRRMSQGLRHKYTRTLAGGVNHRLTGVQHQVTGRRVHTVQDLGAALATVFRRATCTGVLFCSPLAPIVKGNDLRRPVLGRTPEWFGRWPPARRSGCSNTRAFGRSSPKMPAAAEGWITRRLQYTYTKALPFGRAM
jgi:hypothetical protein